MRHFADGRSSPVRAARVLEMSLGSVAYHVRRLADADLVEEVATAPRRGALEHFYELTPVGESLLRSLDEDEPARS